MLQPGKYIYFQNQVCANSLLMLMGRAATCTCGHSSQVAGKETNQFTNQPIIAEINRNNNNIRINTSNALKALIADETY